ncbi:MAG: pyridoxine 5'-phosphate synthase, partial [Acidobacteriota bacterium]
MISLSVNVNKVATLRNSRGGVVPSVLAAVDTCLDAGAPGITVHPRADERHIRRLDVIDIAERLAARRSIAGVASRSTPVEFNIEGDPRPDLIELALQVLPTQVTLVPVTPGEITSNAGWPPAADARELATVVKQLKAAGIRVSLFVDPVLDAVHWAARLGADRIELYTEPYARAAADGDEAGRASFQVYAEAATLAHSLGLGINAGHDLD